MPETDPQTGQQPSVPAAVPFLPAQRGMLAGHLDDPVNPAWTVALLTTLEGRVDNEALAQAVVATATEMDALRLRLDRTTSPPTQWVSPTPGAVVRVLPLPLGPDQHARARRLAEELSEEPWDTSPDAPLVRHDLIAGDGVTWWLQRALHVAIDGYGGWVVRSRILEQYAHLVGSAPLPERSFPSIHELAAACGSDPASLDFWRDELHGAPLRLSPTDRHAPVSGRPWRHDVPLPEEVRARCAAAVDGRTWTYPLITAIGAFAARLSEEPETIVGVPVLGRHGPIERLVPVQMMSVMPLRVTTGPGDTLAEASRSVVARARASRPHQGVPAEDLLRATSRFRSGRLHGAVVNVMPYDEEPAAPGLTAATDALQRGPVYDLLYTVHPLADGSFTIDCLANRSLYTEAQAERMARRLAVWLERATAPGAILDEVDHRLPDEVALGDRLARPRTAGAATTVPRWGETIDAATLAVPGVPAAAPRGLSVLDGLGHPAGLGQVGQVVALTESRVVGTGLLAAYDHEGRLTCHGRVVDRRQVHGRHVEAGAVADRARRVPEVRHVDAHWDGEHLVVEVLTDPHAPRGEIVRAMKEVAPAGTRLRAVLTPVAEAV